MGIRIFHSFSDARSNFKGVLDSADSGALTYIDREGSRYVVALADFQRPLLASHLRSNAQVIAEGGGWVVLLPGLPVHGDGETFDEAIADAIDALREYAEDWNDHLRSAPNHAPNRGVVELVELSTDEQLREWLVASPERSPELV